MGGSQSKAGRQPVPIELPCPSGGAAVFLRYLRTTNQRSRAHATFLMSDPHQTSYDSTTSFPVLVCVWTGPREQLSRLSLTHMQPGTYSTRHPTLPTPYVIGIQYSHPKLLTLTLRYCLCPLVLRRQGLAASFRWCCQHRHL